MVDYLIIIICILALFQSKSKWMVACVFAIVTGLHSITMSSLEGFWYFFSAGVCDALVVGYVARFGKVTKLSDAIMNICVISFFANVYGWILWTNYLPVDSYNLTITALYLIAIFSLLSKERAHDFGHSKQNTGLRLLVCKLGHICSSIREKAGA